MKSVKTLVAGILASIFLLTAFTQTSSAGELDKPSIHAANLFLQRQMLLYFYLKNLNTVYSLGPVSWTLSIYFAQQRLLRYKYSGSTVVGAGQEVKVTPGESFTPSEVGDYTIVVEANSEVNKTGLQKDSITVSVVAPPECPRPTATPPGVVSLTAGNTITYTAPSGCCFRVTPFINTGVWYTLSPTGTQTISDGASVTFTVTPKDPKPLASMVAFRWTECTTGKPAGNDYVVIRPFIPISYDTSNSSTPFPLSFVTLFGDPVSTSTGRFVFDAPADLEFAASPLLRFSRRYDGGQMDAGFAPGIGHNWQHSFSAQLIRGIDHVEVFMHDGRVLGFTKDNGVWKSNNTTTVAKLSEQQGALWMVTDVSHHMQYTFNANGRLVKIDDGRIPAMISWTKDIIDSAYDALGHSITFATDSIGRIISATDKERVVSFGYTAKGELASSADALGQPMMYAYTTRVGELAAMGATIADPLVRMEYNTSHRVANQWDALGNHWIYNWDQGTATLVDPDGVTAVHELNPMGFVTAAGPQGAQVEYTYQNNLPTHWLTPTGTESTVTYHESGGLASITDANGTTTFERSPRQWNGVTVFDVTKLTHPDGTVCLYEYDGRGLATRVTDENGGVWTTRYDSNGNVLERTNPEGRTTTLSYNAMGHPKSITLPSGKTTTVVTDQRGAIISASTNGATRAYTRDALDRLTRFTNETNHQITFTYTSLGSVATITNGASNATAITYNKAGDVISAKKPSGATTSIAHSKAGRISSVTDPMGNSVGFEYDENGFPLRMTDREGNITRYEVNGSAQIVSITSPEQRPTSFAYDQHGRLVKVSSALGAECTVAYDKRDRITTIEESAGRTTTFAYDKRDNVTRMQIGADLANVYQYNKAGELVSVTDGNGGKWKWAYDEKGRCTSISDPSQRTTAYAYDANDRVSTVTLAGTGGTCTNTYDASGNLITAAYSNGPTYHYTYDALGRIVGTTSDTVAFDVDGNITMSNGISMKYNANGWLTEQTFAPGKTVLYQYDKAGRIASIADWNGNSIAYEHDDDGLLTKISRSNGTTTTYERDADGRVTKIDEGNNVTTSIVYNGGQISRVERLGHLPANPQTQERSFTYDAGNAVIEGIPDDMGRPTQVAGSTITWNSASQVVSVRGNIILDVQYDGFSRPIEFSGPQLSGGLVWNDAFADGFPSIIKTARTIYAIATPGGALAYVVDSASGIPMFPHFDNSGNAVMYTAADGSAVSRFAYSPYGEVVNSEGNNSVPFLFAGIGGMVAVTNDFLLTPGRVYIPTMGRFLSADPERSLHPQRLSGFAYAYADPVNWSDYTGRAPQANTSRADELIDASNRRLEEANRRTQEEYERNMRKLEEQSARRRAEREESERRRKDDEERLANQRRDEEERLRADQEKMDRAQRKITEINNVLLAPPAPPVPEQPAPGTTGGGTATNPQPGSGGVAQGGNGTPPSSGGTRTRTPKQGTGNGGNAPNNPGNTGNSNGSGGSRGSNPQPAGPNGTGRGSYNPNLSPTLQYIGAFISGFIEYFTGE